MPRLLRPRARRTWRGRDAVAGRPAGAVSTGSPDVALDHVFAWIRIGLQRAPGTGRIDHSIFAPDALLLRDTSTRVTALLEIYTHRHHLQEGSCPGPPSMKWDQISDDLALHQLPRGTHDCMCPGGLQHFTRMKQKQAVDVQPSMHSFPIPLASADPGEIILLSTLP